MKERLQIRCPFCGKWYTYRKGVPLPKGEGFLKVNKIAETPVFNLLDIKTDTLIKVVIGKVPVGAYSLYKGLAELPENHFRVIITKLFEINEQCDKIKQLIDLLGGNK